MLSHINDQQLPTMVDVSQKPATARLAKASCKMYLPSSVGEIFSDGEIYGPKGPVLHTAIVAGTMATKRTSDLIPFCHPLPIESCKIQIHTEQLTPSGGLIEIECTVKAFHRTGVEMEALVGAQVTALTIYDMCKALSHDMTIGDLRLIEKRGGKCDVDRSSS